MQNLPHEKEYLDLIKRLKCLRLEIIQIEKQIKKIGTSIGRESDCGLGSYALKLKQNNK